jgi:hypothetical protein
MAAMIYQTLFPLAGIDDFRKSQAVRFGYVFSEAQREFWQSKGVTLPGDEPHFFYFERMGLIP